MDKASIEELKELIRTETKKNAMFRNHVLSSLEHYNENISKDLYQKQLKAMIRSATDRYGFIDWNKARALGRAVYELLDSARKQIDHGKFEKAAAICFAVMEEMLEPLNTADEVMATLAGASMRLLTCWMKWLRGVNQRPSANRFSTFAPTSLKKAVLQAGTGMKVCFR
jgi:hypothetical protein